MTRTSNSRLRARGLLLACTALWLILPARIHGESRCVQVKKDGSVWHTIDAFIGIEIRVSFNHSIYGSRVEEVFHLGRDGFHLIELRYGEPRLVEFYGYEGAAHQNGIWIVKPQRKAMASLNLRTSSASSLFLFIDRPRDSTRLTMPADSALYLTIARCKDAHNG